MIDITLNKGSPRSEAMATHPLPFSYLSMMLFFLNDGASSSRIMTFDGFGSSSHLVELQLGHLAGPSLFLEVH